MNFVSEIKRKKGESFDAFLRRVKRRWQQSGKLLQARKIQFFEEKKSKNEKNKRRVAFIKSVAKTEYLRKTGRLHDEPVDKKY